MSRALPAEGTEDRKAIRAIMANWFFVNGLGGARPDDGIQTHERITFRRMIVRLRIDYPRLDEYRDGSLALVFWEALFGSQSSMTRPGVDADENARAAFDALLRTTLGSW